MNHYGYQVENDLFWTGYGAGFEGGAMRLWAWLACDAHFILDIGANTGVYALAAGAMNARAKILALEPVPRIFEKLKANAALNTFNIECVQAAASDQDGQVTLYDTLTEHSYSSSIEASMLPSAMTKPIVVPCRQLDTVLRGSGLPRVDLVKIDVEKHEPAVLRGMKLILDQHRPTMIVEILDRDCADRVHDIVKKYNYEFFFICHTGKLKKVDRVGEYFGNYLFCQEHVSTKLNNENRLLI